MRVRHLSCGSFAPALTGPVVCHILVLESARGLVLVDTGLGTAQLASPAQLGPARHLLRPVLDASQTALAQLSALGYDASAVSDVVLTHLDFDHVGGLPDFPAATVHTTAAEHAAAITAPDWHDRFRYRREPFGHGPAWRLYEGAGELWRGGLRGHAVSGVDGVALIPMPGHSRGHAAVGVTLDDGSLLVHAGDAAFDGASFRRGLAPNRPLWAFEQAVGRSWSAIARNHRALAELDVRPDVTVVNAHDPRLMPS